MKRDFPLVRVNRSPGWKAINNVTLSSKWTWECHMPTCKPWLLWSFCSASGLSMPQLQRWSAWSESPIQASVDALYPESCFVSGIRLCVPGGRIGFWHVRCNVSYIRCFLTICCKTYCCSLFKALLSFIDKRRKPKHVINILAFQASDCISSMLHSNSFGVPNVDVCTWWSDGDPCRPSPVVRLTSFLAARNWEEISQCWRFDGTTLRDDVKWIALRIHLCVFDGHVNWNLAFWATKVPVSETGR